MNTCLYESSSYGLPLRNRLKIGCIVCLVMVLYACKPGVPKGILSESKMERVLHDYHMAQSMAEREAENFEQKRHLYIQKVFEKHKITEAQFDSSMVWYSSHATYLQDIYNRLSERLDEEAKALGVATGDKDLFANLSNQGDTANIWSEKDFYVLRPTPTDNKMTFTIKADTSFRYRDQILWRFNSLFVYSEGMREAYAALMIRYENDSVESSLLRISVDQSIELKLTADSILKIKEISGFIYLNNSSLTDAYRLMIVRNMVLVRFHQQPLLVIPDTTITKHPNTDSLESIRPDTSAKKQDSMPVRRISPDELRESQPIEKKINVVKERKPHYYGRPVNRTNSQNQRKK